jgi:ferredoxin
MKITIDQQKCIGCGSCASVCPDLFEIGDDNKARLKERAENKEEAETQKCAQEAADICPVQAIKVEK